MIRFLERAAETKAALFAVLATCLLVRLGISYYVGEGMLEYEAREYVHIANNIADGKGFTLGDGSTPTAFGNPIYPTFLAIVFTILGDSIAGIPSYAIVQSFLDTVTCWLVFLIAFRATGRKLTAAAAAALYALYLPIAKSSSEAMVEVLALFLTLASILLLVASIRRGAAGFVPAALVMGILILAKPVMIVFPIAVVLMLFLMRAEVTGWLPKALVYTVVSYLVVIPWTIRNYVVMHAFIPISTHGGSTFWGGTGPADGVCLGSWVHPVDTRDRNEYDHPRVPDVSEATYQKITRLQARLRGKSEVVLDRELRAAALREISDHPGRFAFLGVKKVFRLWFNLWHDWPASAGTYAIAFVNSILLVLAAVGYRRKGVDSAFRLTALTLFAYTTVIYMLTYAVVRYSYPVMPFVMILAAAAVFGAGGKPEEKPAQ